MPNDRTIALLPPVGGINRAAPYQRQPPYTTPSAQDVRPYGVLEERHRIGSRPGLGVAYRTQLGSGNPIRMAATLDIQPADGFTFWADDFKGSSQAGVWSGSIPGANGLVVSDGFAQANWLDLLLTGTDGVATAQDVLDDTGDDVDWSVYTIEAGDLVVITNGTDDINDGTYVVQSVAAGALTLTTNFADAGLAGTCTFAVYDARIRGAARDDVTDLDVTEDYELAIWITPDVGSHRGQYRIYGRMDSALDPSAGANGGGFILNFNPATGSGNHSFTLSDFLTNGNPSANSYTPAVVTDGGPSPGWLVVRVYADGGGDADKISVFWLQHTILDKVTVTGTTKRRFGFRMEADVGEANGVTSGCRVSSFRIVYFSDADTNKRPQFPLMASSNGLLYQTHMLSSMIQVAQGSAADLVADRAFQAVSRLGELFIADHGGITHSGTGMVSVDANSVSKTAGGFDAGADPDNNMLVLHTPVPDEPDNTITPGTYEFEVGSATVLNIPDQDGVQQVLATSPFGAGGESISYSIQRGPKVFDADADTLELYVATYGKGFAPVGCKAIALYRDRIVMAVDGTGGLYASRAGDPYDHDYGAVWSDFDRAWALGSGIKAGKLPHPTTAIFTHSDDCMIVGCKTLTYIIRGDPAAGGDVDLLSREVGIVDFDAGCYTPEGWLVFLSLDGLYAVPGGCGGDVIPLSIKSVPRELRDIDPDTCKVSMAYDIVKHGIHLLLDYGAAHPVDHWWFDWESKSLWPVSLQADHGPHVAHTQRPMHGFDRGTVLGCRDGYLRRFHDDFQQDDGGNAIDSHLLIGPIDMGGAWSRSMLRELVGNMAEGSADVGWKLYVADTAEAAVDLARAAATGTEHTPGTFVAGGNFRDHPLASGGSFVLRLDNDEAWPWALERITATIEKLGRQQL
jgi:hypothetical protein